MESNYVYLFSGALYVMVLTMVLGQVLLYRRRLREWEEDPARFRDKPNPARHVFQQVVLFMGNAIIHPMVSACRVLMFWWGHIFALGGCILGKPKLMIWLCDAAETHPMAMQFHRESEDWQKSRSMPGDAFYRWKNYQKDQDLQSQFLICAFMEKTSVFLAKAYSTVAIVFGLLLMPLAIFTPKAYGKTGKENAPIAKKVAPETWSPPGWLTIRGVVMGQTDLTLHTADDAPDDSYVAYIRKAQLNLGAEIVPDTLSANMVLSMANIGRGRDPVFMAYLQWRPAESLSVSAGRILSDVGMGRNPPPHVMIPLTYVDHGINSPLNDHGLKIRWKPTTWFTGSLGAVTGLGVTSAPDLSPDGFAQLNFHPTSGMTIGIGGQTGKQDDGWRHTIAGQVVYTTKTVTTQTEVVSTWDTGTAQATVAWWHMDAVKVAPWAQVYVRGEGLYRPDTAITWKDHKLLAGVNFLPWAKVKLRAALGLPLQTDPTISIHFAAQASF